MLAILIAAPRASRAQTAFAEAEQLFRDGKALMAQKRYAEACEAFKTSLEIDPVVTTKLNLADCREKNQQLATAWGLFVDAERETRGDAAQRGLNDTARARAKGLEARLSFLTISVPDESRVDGLVIARNGAEIEEGLWNRAIPVDGGEVVISGRAPGHEEWSTTLDVPVEGGRQSVDVPRFKELRTLVEPPVAPDAVIAVPAHHGGSEPEPRKGRRSGRRTVALWVGGASLVTATVGAGFGWRSRTLDSEAFRLCPEPATPCADADEATRASQRSVSNARIANVSFGLAAVAAVASVVLWMTDDGPSVDRRVTWAPEVSGSEVTVQVQVSY